MKILSELKLEDLVKNCKDSELKVGKVYPLAYYDPNSSFCKLVFGANYASVDPSIKFDVEEHEYGLKISHTSTESPLAFICRGIHFEKTEHPFYIITIEKKDDLKRKRLINELTARLAGERADKEARIEEMKSYFGCGEPEVKTY